MLSTLEQTSTLGRRLSIEVPAESIEQAVREKLKDVTKTIKLPGFRPGHVDESVVEQKYGKDIRDEVIHDLMHKACYDAIEEQKLKIAARPHVEHDHDNHPSPGEPLKFVVECEVFPEIPEVHFQGFDIEKISASVTEEDVDKTLASIAKQQATFESVDRPSQKGDQVLIDFDGMLDDKPLENGSAKDFRLELGAGSFIADLENGIVGMTKGEDKYIDATFPENYQAAHLAGKTARFHVHVADVLEPKLPPMDDAFAEKLGMKEGGLTKLRAEIRKNLERELSEALTNHTRNQVMEKLLAANPLELPKGLIEQEAVRMQQEMHERMGKQVDFEAFAKLMGDNFKEQAGRRVSMGLLVSRFIELHAIKTEPEQVKARIQMLAGSYEQPDQFVQWFYQDKQRLGEIEAFVLEQNVIDKILATANLTEKTLSFEELIPRR